LLRRIVEVRLLGLDLSAAHVHLCTLGSDVGHCRAFGFLRLSDLRLGLAKAGLQFLGIETGNDLTGADRVAFVDEHFLDASRELGRDEELVCLETPVTGRDAVWEPGFG